MADVSEVTGDATARTVFGLALPALGVLAAEPIYLLFDIAVVGRLGALALAGLAVGGLILAQVSTQLTFLSYGTTARASRMHGAGDERGAVREGVQATWLALGIGALVIALAHLFARPVTSAIAGGSDIAAAAESWLRIAVFGAPLILVAMAGNGWMRGVQNTVRPLRFVIAGLAVSAVACPVLVHGLWGAPRLELEGSAVANVIGQAVSASLFVGALVVERVPLRPRWHVMRAQMVLGRDLILRSLAFQACFLSAAAVASRFGAALGAGHAKGATRLSWRITRWSTIFATGLALIFALGHGVIPELFTSDQAVLDEMAVAWWFFVAIMPVAGVVFALDGVLLGAGDVAFLRNATLSCALVGFLPLIWLSMLRDWGLAGIWTGLTVFIILRMLAVVWRVGTGRWAVVGADLQTRHGSDSDPAAEHDRKGG